MKSIIIKKDDGSVRCYSSGWAWKVNEDGTTKEIEKTDEEMLQRCYERLIEDIRREEFDKNIISLLKNYFKQKMIDWQNIQIKITYLDNDHRLELNISNPENRF